MASRNISVSHAKQQLPLLLHNATIYYPGLVLAPSLSMAIKPESDAAQSVARVLYNLRGPCDDRNLYAVVPSGKISRIELRLKHDCMKKHDCMT